MGERKKERKKSMKEQKGGMGKKTRGHFSIMPPGTLRRGGKRGCEHVINMLLQLKKGERKKDRARAEEESANIWKLWVKSIKYWQNAITLSAALLEKDRRNSPQNTNTH